MSKNKRKNPREIWVVLPTYNEAENLPPMLDALLSLDLALKIIVVDDASPDGTGEIAERAALGNSRIQVIRRIGERGLGTAYLAGFRLALAADDGVDAILTMDCDFSHDPAAIPALVEALDSADVVVGSRYVAGGGTRNWGFHRKILSASANRFARALFRLPVRDCTSGFRLYRREVLEAVPWQRVRSTGYAFLVETLHLAARRANARVKEAPIQFADRTRGSTKMGLREVAVGVINLLRLKADLFRNQRDGESD